MRKLKDPPANSLYPTSYLQKHLHLQSFCHWSVSQSRTTHTFRQTALHSSHTASRVDSHQAEQAHNEFEELHTYSKVIYFISPIKGSDKIVARHCKSISLTRYSSHQDLQIAKLIPQGSHTEPLSKEFKEGLISHKNVCL